MKMTKKRKSASTISSGIRRVRARTQSPSVYLCSLHISAASMLFVIELNARMERRCLIIFKWIKCFLGWFFSLPKYVTYFHRHAHVALTQSTFRFKRYTYFLSYIQQYKLYLLSLSDERKWQIEWNTPKPLISWPNIPLSHIIEPCAQLCHR